MPLDRRHPSKSKLLRWLETGESDKVQTHVESCERCADRLVVLDQDEVGDTTTSEHEEQRRVFAQALSDAYRAPADLNERVVRGVEQRSKTETEIVLFAGLMAVGFDTARLVSNLSGTPIDNGRDNNARYGQDEQPGDEPVDAN